MGTNYYVRLDCCKECGRAQEELHIGKLSVGWPFHVHVIPEQSLNCWEDWLAFFKATGAKIYNEYDERVTIFGLNELVERQRKHADREHVLEAQEKYPHVFKKDKKTGDILSEGEFC